MADYIYLLQTRLTAAQLSALEHVRNAARSRSMTVFLVGGAVRDLTSGAPIRDLDFAVQGNATKLRKDLERVGGTVIGENEATQSLYMNFPGGVRLEVGATLTATFPKPGKPVYKAATILEDLRRRDFTANAMAISLNDGSYGLLMDPLNGIADLENRELRLVSNYGFIEDPARMIRAARFGARLSWGMEEKTRQRYETGKTEDYISALGPHARAYELEEIFHEEDPLRVLRRLEAEGWMKYLFAAWTSKTVNEAELERLRDTLGQLEQMGIHPDPSPAFFPLLTAKLAPKDVAALKKSFARPGFVDQIAALEAQSRDFAAVFSAKENAAPSATWKLLYSSAPEPVLWLAHTSKAAAVQNKFKSFLTEWSNARTRIPYQLMQEMRIVPDLPVYAELLDKLFFAIMDGKLDTPEAARAFLEPYSPPAPPPPVNLRRRAVKRETKPVKRPKKAVAPPPDTPEALPEVAPPAPAKPIAKPAAPPAKAAKQPAPKVVAKPTVKVAARQVTRKPAPAKVVTKQSAVKQVAQATKKAAPTKPAPTKKPVKAVAKKPTPKPVAKKAAKPVPKPPAKKAPAKPAPKKVAKPVAKKVVKKAAAKKPTPRPTKPANKKDKKSGRK